MKDKDMYLIAIVIVIGIMQLILGLILLKIEKDKRKSAVALVKGKVVDYYFKEDIIAPVVMYEVMGKRYLQKRKFRAIVSIKNFLTIKDLEIESHVCLDDDDILHVHGGAVNNYKPYLSRMYPMGSKVNVYYDPNKPKNSYVERIPEAIPQWIYLSFINGFLVLLIAFLIFTYKTS